MKKLFIRALSLVLVFTFVFSMFLFNSGSKSIENRFNVYAASADNTLCHYLEEIHIVETGGSYPYSDFCIRRINGDYFTDENGNRYDHGLICYLGRSTSWSSPKSAYSIFDLDGKYVSLEGKCVLVSNHDKARNAHMTLSFYGDGTLLNSYQMNQDSMPFSFKIDVKGVKELKIEANDNATYFGWTKIGLADMELISKVMSVKKAENVLSSGKPRVDWWKYYGATGYQVYRSTSANGSYTLIGSTTKLGYTDETAKSGKTYYYKVRAELSNSRYSAFCGPFKIICKPARPALKTSNDKTTGAPVISWKAAKDAEGYQVYRSDSENGTYTRIANTVLLTAKDKSTSVGCSYYYKVRSIDENGIAGAFSLKVLVTAKCAKPTGIKGSNVKSSGYPRITWNAVEGAVKYQVYRAAQKSGTYTRIGVPTKTGATDSTAFSGKTYYYKVRAVDANGAYGAFSDVISVTCK